MMQYVANFLLVISGVLLPYHVTNAAPASIISSRETSASDPATVYFAPYKETGCRMSQNPHDSTAPITYNITTGSGCVTPIYAFGSYVESANSLAANGPCSLSIYTGAGCTGTVKTGARTTYSQCVTDGSAAGKSLRLACGP